MILVPCAVKSLALPDLHKRGKYSRAGQFGREGKNWSVVRDQIYQPMFGSKRDSDVSLWTATKRHRGLFVGIAILLVALPKRANEFEWSKSHVVNINCEFLASNKHVCLFVCLVLIFFFFFPSGVKEKGRGQNCHEIQWTGRDQGRMSQFGNCSSLLLSTFVCFDTIHLRTQAAATMVSGCVSRQLAIPWKPPVYSRPGRAWLYCPTRSSNAPEAATRSIHPPPPTLFLAQDSNPSRTPLCPIVSCRVPWRMRRPRRCWDPGRGWPRPLSTCSRRGLRQRRPRWRETGDQT